MSINIPFFKRVIFEYRRSLLGYSLGLAAFGLMMALFYPTVKNSFAQMEGLIESYPEPMRKAFGMELNSFQSIEGFLAVEYFSFFWVLILAIFIFSIGASFMAGEVDKGTSDYAYALPLKRRDILLSKFAGGYLIALAAGTAGIVASLLGAYMVGEKPSLLGFGAMFVTGAALVFFLLSVSALFSALFNSRGRVYAMSAFVFAASYVLHILEGLTNIGGLYYASLFKYYGSAEDILKNTSLEPLNIAVFLFIGLILLASSLHFAEKRDL